MEKNIAFVAFFSSPLGEEGARAFAREGEGTLVRHKLLLHESTLTSPPTAMHDPRKGRASSSPKGEEDDAAMILPNRRML